MLKSPLFNNLFEGAGSNRPNRNEINAIADIDKERAAAGKPKKEQKPVKVKQGASVKNINDAYLQQKATYGNLYTVDSSSLDILMAELSGLPFKFGGKSVRQLLTALKAISFNSQYPQVISAITNKKNAALVELAEILQFSGPIEIKSNSDVRAQLQPVPDYILDSKSEDLNTNAYAALIGLVFPFIDPAVLNRSLNEFENVNSTLQKYSDAYTGALLVKIDWVTGDNIPDFASFGHIADKTLAAFLSTIKSMVDGTTESTLAPRLLKLASAGGREATAAFSKSITANIASQKHIRNIVKNIYYSLITRALPFNADLFELNDTASGGNEVKKFFDNPQAATRPQILSDKAETLISARILSVEKNPFLYKGLLGHNSRVQLAFDYAKLVAFKKNKSKALVDKTTDKIATLFEDILKNVPGMSEHFNKLSSIFDKYFHPTAVESVEPDTSEQVSGEEPTSPLEKVTEAIDVAKNTSNAASLKTELDAFAEEGLNIINTELSTDVLMGIFKKVSAHNPEIKETDPKQVVDIYLQPFKNAIIGRLSIIQAITKEDIEAIFNVGNAITDFLADAINKKSAKEYLATFEAYDKARATTGDDEGYKFLRLVSDIQSLVQQAKKKLKKTKTQANEPEKKETKKINRSAVQYKAIRDARKKILDTKHKLQTLPTEVSKLLLDIKNRLNGLSSNALTALISGAAEEAEQEEINKFLESTVNSLYDVYFNPTNLGLLATDELDADIVKVYVSTDLIEKANKGYLIASGSLKSYVDYYEGITPDFIDFINLAASIKESHEGISLDASGNINFNYSLETLSPKDAFFTKFFFGELTSKVSAEPVVSLAAQRLVLKRLQEPLLNVLNTVSMEQFLTPDLIKEQPELAKKLNEYIVQLKHSAVAGIPSAIKQIDADILDLKGGQNVPMINVGKILTFAIPAEINEEYEKTISVLGANALDALWNSSGTLNTSKEFFRQLIIVETAGGSLLEEIFNKAIDIISTAINIDVARQTVYGDQTQIAAVNGLLRKYQKEGNVEAVNDIIAAKAKANEFLNSLTFATAKKVKGTEGDLVAKAHTGVIGTNVLSGTDNHIDNQLLFNVLRKFNVIITQDSWAKYAENLATEVTAQKAEGTYVYSDLNVIVKKIGMAFTKIGKAVVVEGPKQPVTEAIDPNETIKNSADTMQQLLQAPLEQGERGIKANYSALKVIVKDMEKRIYGFETTTLNKGQRHGQQVKLVTSYKELFRKASAGMKASTEIIGSFFASTNNKSEAVSLVKTTTQIENNFNILEEFFSIIAGGGSSEDPTKKTSDTPGAYTLNVPTQKRLLETLQKLTPVQYSDIFETTFIATPSSTSSQFTNRLAASFSRTPGLSALYELLKSGHNFEQIKVEVARMLEEMAKADPATRAEFLSFADLRELDPLEIVEKEKKVKTEVQPATTAVSPIEAWSGKQVRALLTALDPETYKAITDPTQITKLKQTALGSLKNIKDPKVLANTMKYLNSQLNKGITNQYTGNKISSLLDISSLFESKKVFALALIEAAMEESEEEKAKKEATARNAQQLQEEPIKVLAAVLAKRGISSSKGQLIMNTGKPYLWDDWSPAYWLLFKTSPTLEANAKLVSRLFSAHDTLEFYIGNGRYEHAEMLKFTELKQLVDTYYKPEQLNTESTNESEEFEEE